MIKRGDYLYIDNVGAYGASMSSTYNSRSLIPEVLVNKRMFSEIRKRMNSEDFMRLERFPKWLK